ncbi:hypothetical protein Tco_0161642 [Tanacetum coccineum]
MAFVPKHNQVGFLKKPEGSAGFEQIVDFLKGTHIRYALEHNPTIYVSVIKQFWQTVTVITLDNGEQELKATIDTHEYTISESSVRNKLKLADENGITEFTNAEIFEGMANLGGFAGVNRPLLANMIAGHDENQGEPQEEPVESQPPPNASVPSTSQPTTEPHPDQELETETELHGSSSDFVHTPPTQVETSSPELKSISPEPMEHTYDQPQPSPVQQPASLEPQPTSPPKSPPLQGPTSTYVEATRINVADLLHLVPQLVTRIDHLEKELKEHKQTTAAVIVKLVASQKTKTYTRGVKSGLKKKLDVGVSSDDRKFTFASEEIKSGFTNISSGERLLRIPSSRAAEIERKDDIKRLDALAAKRLNDEFEMSEQQRKRDAEVLKKEAKGLDVEDIPIPESCQLCVRREMSQQPVLKMSRRKSKARKGMVCHTSTESESGEVDITSLKIMKWKILRHGGKGYCHLIRANQRDQCCEFWSNAAEYLKRWI